MVRGENIDDGGLSTVYSFWHLVEVLAHIPHGQEGWIYSVPSSRAESSVPQASHTGSLALSLYPCLPQ